MSSSSTASSYYTLAADDEPTPEVQLNNKQRSVILSTASPLPSPGEKVVFAFERIAARTQASSSPPFGSVASGSGATTPTQLAEPERSSYIRTRAISTHPTSTPSSSSKTNPYGQLEPAAHLHYYGGLPRQRAHSSFSPSCPLPRPHSLTPPPPLPPPHPLAERRGTVGPKPLSLAVNTKNTKKALEGRNSFLSPSHTLASPSTSRQSSPVLTPTSATRRYQKPTAMDVHSPAPTSPAAFFDVMQDTPSFDGSSSGSSVSSESDSEDEDEEIAMGGNDREVHNEDDEEEYTPLPRSPFITSPLGPGHFRIPSPAPASPLCPSPFTPANYPDHYSSQTSGGGGFWSQAKAARSTPTIATSKRSIFSPKFAAFSPTLAKFARKGAGGIFGRKTKGAQNAPPHISTPVPVSILVFEQPLDKHIASGSDSGSGLSSGPLLSHALPACPPSPGLLSPSPASPAYGANNYYPQSRDVGLPSPTTPAYTFSPSTVNYPPSPITPASPDSPGMLSPGLYSTPAPLSPWLLAPLSPSNMHDRDMDLKDDNEKALEKEARRGLKRDKNGRVNEWVSSQLSLSLLSSSVEAALGSAPNNDPAISIVAEPRASEDSVRSGSVKELESMLMRHMEDERERFKRIAGGSGSMGGGMSLQTGDLL